MLFCDRQQSVLCGMFYCSRARLLVGAGNSAGPTGMTDVVPVFLLPEASDGWFGREGAANVGRGLVVNNKKIWLYGGKIGELGLDKPAGKGVCL